MSDKKSTIKQAFIAVLCEHPDADSYKSRAFSGDSLFELQKAMADGGQNITKEDFLTPDDAGKYIVASEGGWRNFDKVVDIVHRNGEKFEAEDFRKEIGMGKTLLDSAEQHGGLSKIFNAEVWAGRYEEMEKLWFHVSAPARRRFNDGEGLLPIKREIYKAEGKTVREDDLKEKGVDYRDIPQLFTERGRFEEIQRKLAAHNDTLKKEDLFFVDKDGDTLFHDANAWDNFGKITALLEKNGEQLDVDDFLFKRREYSKNILQRAVEHDALDKVFAAKLWVGRIDSMVDLWSNLKPGEKGRFGDKDFEDAVAEAEDLTYGKLVTIDDGLTKATLLTALNPDDEKQVLPLGLKTVWQNIEKIEEILGAKGEKITIDDLRQKSGKQENTNLMCGTKAGFFDKIVEMSVKSGDALSLDDLTTRNRQGTNVLQMLAEQKQLDLAFTPELWAGRVNEMQTLWQNVPLKEKHQVDYEDVHSKVTIASVKMRKNHKLGNRPKLKRNNNGQG